MKININILQQGLVRCGALVIPLILLNIVRLFYEYETQTVFFSLLTIVVPLSIFFKAGLDVTLPRAKLTKSSKIILNQQYLIFILGINLLFWMASITILNNELVSVAMSAVPLVVLCYICAEIGRARNNYIVFYLFKAPIIYCIVFFYIAVLESRPLIHQLVTFMTLLIILLYFCISNIKLEQKEIHNYEINSFLTSVVMQIFLWKESLFSFLFLASSSLIELTTYGRYKVIITFVFIAYNSTIPNLIRNHKDPLTEGFLLKANNNVLKLSMAWAFCCYIVICILVFVVYPTELLVACGILMCAVITIIFGNITSILNCLGYEKKVFSAFVYGILMFFALSFCLVIFTTLPNVTSVVIAAIVSQITTSLYLKNTFTALLKEIRRQEEKL